MKKKNTQTNGQGVRDLNQIGPKPKRPMETKTWYDPEYDRLMSLGKGPYSTNEEDLPDA